MAHSERRCDKRGMIKDKRRRKCHGLSASSPLPAYRHCATSWLFYCLIPLKVISQMYHFIAPQTNQRLLEEKKNRKLEERG